MYEPRAEQKSQGKITVKIIWAPVSNLKKREREKEEAVPNNPQRCRITSSFYDPSGVGRVFPGGHWWMLPLESVLGENLFSFTTCCGCHCFQRTTTLCVCICACVCLVLSDSLQPHGLWPIRVWLLCPWNFPCKNTGVGCHFLLQGIFLNQGSNLCLLNLLHR